MAEIWYRAEGTGRDVIHEATSGVVAIFERHGAVMEALADAAADDHEVELAYRGSQDFFIQATAKHIQGEIDAGNILPCNAAETARALCIMNENYLRTCWAGTRRSSRPRGRHADHDLDPHAVRRSG